MKFLQDALLRFMLVLTLKVHLYAEGFSPGCPLLCVCIPIHSRPPRLPEPLKLTCGGEGRRISSMTELHFSSLSLEANQLDLSDNNIERVVQNTFQNFTALQKLDLSKNQIRSIEKGAFLNLDHLKRLDLSSNKLDTVYAIFSGLGKLERLKLNQNMISYIREGTFDELLLLKQLDISGNPLICNCGIMWLLDWARDKSIKLAPPPKCDSPPYLTGQPLRKLKLGSELQCTEPPTAPVRLELTPTKSQVVFEGDALRLHCRAPAAQRTPLAWLWEGQEAGEAFTDVDVRHAYSAERGTVESWLDIEHLWSNHSGQWHCHLVEEQGNQTLAIAVIVMSEKTQYCSQEVTSGSKGSYAWPKTVLGFPADLPCEGEPPGASGRHASRLCTRHGRWAAVDAAACPYVSETTKILEQFAKMNLSLSRATVVESAKRLRSFAASAASKQFRDPMDVVFAARTVENYLDYVGGEKELGAILVDVVGLLLRVPRDVLLSAQLEDRACARLVRAVERAAENAAPALQAHRLAIVAEAFDVRRDTFSGLTCFWYAHVEGGRVFHCSNSNASALLGSKAKVIEASIQVPGSLFRQLEMQGVSTVAARQLTVAAYENGRLFPRADGAAAADGLDVASAVAGVRLVGVDVGNLTEPVYVVLRAPPSTSRSAGTPRPVWWDGAMDGGRGGWSSQGCQLSYLLDGLLVFQCNRMGYFGLLQKTSYLFDESGSLFGMKFRLSHPGIYVGSFVGVITLLAAIVSFVLCHSSIRMSTKTKHSLVNTWVALALLCFAFAAGIHQTEDVRACQCVGLALHYLTLSALLWMAVTVSNMYKRLTRGGSSRRPPDDELPSDQPPAQKPLLGLYLVGWGIGLIVCGISGAVNIREYAGHTHCFLTAGPATSAVVVPAAMLILYLAVFYLLIRCAARDLDANAQLSEGTQVTENVDIDLLDSGVNNAVAEAASLHSTSTPTTASEVEDSEYSPLTQLRAHVIVLCTFVLMWAAAALATVQPFHFAYEEAIFSVVYAVLALCLGGFILFFYCIARSDVRGEWYVMRCWCRRKQGGCCRTRNVSDTNPGLTTLQPLPSNIAAVAATSVVASRHSVNNSISHHTDKTASTNKSLNAAKAAVELNGRTAVVKVDLGVEGASNVNLVALHRQQYRSNNSVMTYTEASGTSGAEMYYYNLHQSTTARKFFRKQRRHLRQNNLGTRRCGDGGGGDTDSNRPKSVTSGSRSICNAGSKVNNTEVYVEPDIKESRSENTNLLIENNGENPTKDLPMERLVIGAEEAELPVSSVDINDSTVINQCEEVNVECELGEAVLAELAADFQAIKEEMKLNRMHRSFSKDLESSPTPSYSEEDFVSRTNSGVLDSSFSIENSELGDRLSITELRSEMTIPETCSFISNSDSRISSGDIDSDSVGQFHNESLLSVNDMVNEMINIGISSPDLSHARYRTCRKDVPITEGDSLRHGNNSPTISGYSIILGNSELECLTDSKKQCSAIATLNSTSLVDISYVNGNEENGTNNKKETSV